MVNAMSVAVNTVIHTIKHELGGCLFEVTITSYLDADAVAIAGDAFVGELAFIREDTGEAVLYVEAYEDTCAKGLSCWEFFPAERSRALDALSGGIYYEDFLEGYDACCNAVEALLKEAEGKVV